MYNGIDMTITGGLVIQSDKERLQKFHFGFVHNGDVTWLDYGRETLEY